MVKKLKNKLRNKSEKYIEKINQENKLINKLKKINLKINKKNWEIK